MTEPSGPLTEQSLPLTEAYGRGEGDSLDDSFDTSILTAPSNPSSLGRLGKYEIEQVLGQGGMGVVFRGFDETLHRPVAIKVLSRQLSSSPTARRRFIREARAAAAINHPNVVTIHAVEDQAGLPYLVMELIDGQSLHDLLRERGPLELAEVLRLGSQIAAGLAAAHAQGVIHRDIKPSNIMLEDHVQRVKITDFGLARVAVDNSDLTSQGHQMGTPAYMSPEQVRGPQVDERADLFSFGCVLYAMLGGRSPFRSANPFETARRILEDTPEPLDRLNPEVPPFLVEIVERLLAKKPAARFQSAAELAELLQNYTTQLNQATTDELRVAWRGERLRSKQGQRSPKSAALIALLVCGVLLAAAIYWRPWASPNIAATGPEVDSPGAALPLRPGVFTVSQTGQAQFKSIQEALRMAGPDTTIEVLDDATYAGALAIADAERLRNLTIVALNHAKLIAPFGLPVIKIDSTPGVTIRGFRVEAYHGQHGIEITGPCARTELAELAATRVPNANSVALVNFVYLHAGAAGTEEAPIVLRKLSLRGGGHGIAIGELKPTEADLAQPVRFVRIEECTLDNPEGRLDYRLFLLNHVADIVIARNTFADADIGISLLLKGPNHARRIRIEQNTFHNLTGWLTLDANLAQDEFTLVSNLISRTDCVTPGRLPPSELPTSWFVDNAWLASTTTSDEAASAVATIVQDARFESENPADPNYLRPAADSAEALRAVGRLFPGRHALE